ncbi:hypothetical protein BDW71DRAFT_194511 [Aspergillus fruticulosus]
MHGAGKSLIQRFFPFVFGDNATVKGSPSYEEHRSQWFPSCYQNPTVIITPITTTQVAQILALTHVLGAPFNNGGVVISFCKGEFTQLVLSEDKKMVDIAVGLRWADVYEKLDEHGLAVAGGREPRVGVAGLLFGGGLSYQCNEVGVGCMGVVDYENENPELFWTLKGGGPNFGIITKVEMTILPNTFWSANRLYSASQNTAFLSAIMTYYTLIESNNKASLIYHTVNDRTFVSFTYSGAVDDGHPNIFKPFQHIPYMRYLVPPARRTQCVPADVDRADLTMVSQPMSSLFVKAAHNRGGNPFGLESVGHQIFLILADYTNPADTSRIQATMCKIVDTVEETAKKNGSYLPFRYANYAVPDQDPLVSYGEEKLSTLREVAEKYDPERIFQVLQNGGLAVHMAAATG